MKRILVCEDEAAIRGFVVINLRRAGFEVEETASGEEALERYDALEGRVDVALLDVMLPGIDGFSVCRQLRRRSTSLGIILLTARTQEEEKVLGFRQGADDYVTKPFSPSELVARVEALCRRMGSPVQTAELLTVGELALDMRSHTLLRRGEPVELTQVEFQMLHFFFTHPNQVLTRLEILREIWGEDFAGEEKIVDVNIRRLRMKVESDPSAPAHLTTVWGRGYRWVV